MRERSRQKIERKGENLQSLFESICLSVKALEVCRKANKTKTRRPTPLGLPVFSSCSLSVLSFLALFLSVSNCMVWYTCLDSFVVNASKSSGCIQPEGPTPLLSWVSMLRPSSPAASCSTSVIEGLLFLRLPGSSLQL